MVIRKGNKFIELENLLNFDFNFEDEYIKFSSDIKEEEKGIKEVAKKEVKKEFNSNGTFENYLNYEKEKYIKASKDKEYKQFLYTNRIIMQNTKTNESFNLNHSILQKSRDNYLYFFYTQKIMEEKYVGNDDYLAIFLTLTTPSKFHKYSSITNKLNPKFDKTLTINDAYKLLNSSFREIYKNFKIKRKFVKVEYSKVLEPHKNLTPHLHAIIYVNRNDLEFMQNHIKNVIKKNGIGEHKIEVINDTSRSSAYLLKYIQKTTNPKNEEEFHFFNGWKKVNKIRVFTSSSSILDKAIYKKINTITKLSNGLDNKNAIQNVLDNCNIKIKQKEIDIDEDFDFIEKKAKTKTKGNPNGRYKVKVVKEKINKMKYIGMEYMNILNGSNDKEGVIDGNFDSFKRFISYFQEVTKVKLSKSKLKDINEKFEYYQKNLILGKKYSKRKGDYTEYEGKDRYGVLNFGKGLEFNEDYMISSDIFFINEEPYEKTSLFELIFKDLYIITSLYRVVDFKIYDKLKKEVIYNKKDFTFEMDQELSCINLWKDEFVKERYLENLYGDDFFSLNNLD